MRQIILLAALVASSAFAGSGGPNFRGEYPGMSFFRVPDIIYPETAPEVIPGSRDGFYAEVKVGIPEGWNVYTNGILALTNIPSSINSPAFPGVTYDSVYKYTDGYPWDIPSSDYGKYHLDVVVNEVLYYLGLYDPYDPERLPWRPALYDFGILLASDYVRFIASGSVDFADIDDITHLGKLYQPASARIDLETYAAMLNSYEAYFERLYAASMGQKVDWDDDSIWPDHFRFKVPDGPDLFDFDDNLFTNGVRWIDSTRKLVEINRLKKLRAVLRDEMFNEDTIVGPPHSGSSPPSTFDFVYRPDFITDPDAGVDDLHSSFVWWSSSTPPPVVTNETQRPDIYGFGFVPETSNLTDWNENPLSATSVSWPCLSVTLNMGRSDSGASHPINMLFRNVGYGTHPGESIEGGLPPNLNDVIHQYQFFGAAGGIYGWMTNEYPRCVSQYYDSGLAFTDYLKSCWGLSSKYGPSDDSGLRRLAPNDYVGINQLLGLMDRTIHIPSFRVVSTNYEAAVYRSTSYEADEETVIGFHVDQDTMGVTFTRGDGERTRFLDSCDYDESVISDIVEVNGAHARSGVPSFGLRGGLIRAGGDSDAFIDEDFFKNIGLDVTNRIEFAHFVGAGEILPSQLPRAFTVGYLWIYPESIPPGRVYDAYISGVVTTNMFDGSFTPHAGGSRTYTCSWPLRHWPDEGSLAGYHAGSLLGPIQPGDWAGSIVKSNVCARLFCRDWFTWTGDDYEVPIYSMTNVAYRFGERDDRFVYLHPSELIPELNAEAVDMALDCRNIVLEKNGYYNPGDPGSYAPFPSIVEATLNIPTGQVASIIASANDIPEEEMTFTNNIYRYWFYAGTNYAEVAREDVTEEYGIVSDFYELTVTNYLGSGLETVTTNGHSVIPWRDRTEYVTSTNSVESHTEYFEYMAGPYNGPRETCPVPTYGETNVTTVSFVRYNNHWRQEGPLTRFVFDGNGPDDPGDFLDKFDEIWTGDEWDDIWVDPSSISTNETHESGVTYTEISTNEAFRVTGGEVETVLSSMRADWNMDAGGPKDISIYLCWTDPFTGEEVRHDLPFPYKIGRLHLDVDAGMTFSDIDDGGNYGCTDGCSVSSDFKIMTLTDWDWTFLNKGN